MYKYIVIISHYQNYNYIGCVLKCGEIIMPGRIMTAQQAAIEYGKRFKSIKRIGNTVTLKNSMGKKVTVSKNTRVYHRGRGNFGIYLAAVDAKRICWGATTLGGRGAIGGGPYRHTSDYRRRG